MDIFERIQYLRKKVLKMTQDKFGIALGVTRDTIANIEQNRLVKPEQKEPLYKLICKTFNVNYEWLINGNGEMLITSVADEKEAAIRQLSAVYSLDELDKKWLDIVLSLPPEDRKHLKALALSLAEDAAKKSGDMEAGEEIVADAQAAHNAAFDEQNRELTEEEMVELYRQRLRASKKDNAVFTTYEKPTTGNTGAV